MIATGYERGNGVDFEAKLSVDNYCAAKNANIDNYQGFCETHGRVNFSTRTRKCLTCWDSRGRATNDTPRATARRAGDTVYIDNCEKHGARKFSVRYGACLECTTMAGLARKPPRSFEP